MRNNTLQEALWIYDVSNAIAIQTECEWSCLRLHRSNFCTLLVKMILKDNLNLNKSENFAYGNWVFIMCFNLYPFIQCMNGYKLKSNYFEQNRFDDKSPFYNLFAFKYEYENVTIK